MRQKRRDVFFSAAKSRRLIRDPGNAGLLIAMTFARGTPFCRSTTALLGCSIAGGAQDDS